MLTAADIRDELGRAFAGNHGAGCDCCEPFPDGRSPLRAELEREARYAVARYGREIGLVDDPRSDADLEEVAQLAAADALAAARAAITERAVFALAGAEPSPPVIVPIDPATHRPACRAETFDGAYRRQCTRPASFLRDGLEVCRQHARLERIRAIG